MSSSAIYSGITMPSSPSRVDSSIDDSTRCVICKQATCDIQIVSCGCLLHTVSLHHHELSHRMANFGGISIIFVVLKRLHSSGYLYIIISILMGPIEAYNAPH